MYACSLALTYTQSRKDRICLQADTNWTAKSLRLWESFFEADFTVEEVQCHIVVEIRGIERLSVSLKFDEIWISVVQYTSKQKV